MQTGTLDPHILSALVSGAATGRFSAEDRQGFCGGHGVCLTGAGDAGRVERTVPAWMRRHLAGDASVDTGPRFQWVADDARWRASDRFPLATADTLSGTPITAGPAINAVNVPIPAPAVRTDVVGEPRLELSYRGPAVNPSAHVFAQIVDRGRGVVLGNQATPIPLTLDGRQRTVSRRLEGVAASAGPASRYELQVIGGTTMYGPARNAGLVRFGSVRIELPAGAPATGG